MSARMGPSLLILWFGVTNATASTLIGPSVSSPFLEESGGARAAGMGGAYTAVSDDASALAWNPGGLARQTHFSAQLMDEQFGEGMSLGEGAMSFPTPVGSFGASWTSMDYGAIVTRDTAGSPGPTKNPVDSFVSGAYAFPFALWQNVRGGAGGSLGYVQPAFGKASLGANLGALLNVGRNTWAGLSVLHLGPSAGGFSPPSVAHLGASMIPTTHVRASLDLGYRLAAGDPTAAAGVEFTPFPVLALRAGYRWGSRNSAIGGSRGLSWGFGVALGWFGFDWSFESQGSLASLYRAALVFGPAQGDRAPRDEETTVSEPPHSEPGNSVRQEPAPAQEAIVASPSSASLYAEAVALYNTADYDGAWRDAYAVLQLDPQHWQAWQVLGNCQYAKGDRPGAIQSYERSLVLNPQNPALQSLVDQMKNQR